MIWLIAWLAAGIFSIWLIIEDERRVRDVPLGRFLGIVIGSLIGGLVMFLIVVLYTISERVGQRPMDRIVFKRKNR